MRFSIVAAASNTRRAPTVSGRSLRLRVLLVLAIAVAVGGLLGGVLRLAWPPSALAATCSGSPYGNDIAADGNHAGVRSTQMTVEDYAVTCGEIDSVGLIGPGQATVEIGVSHDGSGVADCKGGHTSDPYLFLVHTDINGNYYCNQPSGQSVTAWDKEGFSVQDQDQSGDFKFAHNGSNFSDTFGTLDWTKGIATTNSERHNAADTSWGHFESNYYMNVTNGWTAFDSLTLCLQNNNNKPNTPFFQQIWSPSNITVSTGSQNCP
jgi:hypothetical protein